MLKFLNGEKKLGEAFWLSVTLVLLSTITVLLLEELDVFASFSSLLLATFLITIPVRLFAWVSVLRCLKNSTNSLFKGLAATLVVVDIVHKLFFWSVVGFNRLEHRSNMGAHNTRLERCKTEIAARYDQPVDNLHGEPRLDYGSGEPAYEIHTRTRTTTYRCRFEDSGVELAEEPYVKWYRHSRDADTAGTSLVADIELIPGYLARSYGAPGPGDGLRVSGMYTFISDAGEVFTIYDYKSTTAWDTDSGLPTPEDFWSSGEPVELSVGGAHGSDHESFVAWIEEQQARWERRNR